LHILQQAVSLPAPVGNLLK